MNSFKVFFCLSVVATASAIPTGYNVEVSHEHHPVVHHEEYIHSQPQALEAAAYSYGGEEAYGHGDDSHHDYPDHHPSYKYEYGVKDPKSGDHHSAWEHRDGDVVHGEYSLDEADGTKRIVKYTSDKKNGFNAVVEKIGHAHHDHGHHY